MGRCGIHGPDSLEVDEVGLHLDPGDCLPHTSGGAPQFLLLPPGFQFGIAAESDIEPAICSAIGVQL